MRVGIIGGGAAGFFSAIHVKENYPDSEVIIFEKSLKTLSKVRISGGGRCNVTNACTSISQFAKAYPRGQKLMKKLMSRYNNSDVMRWFEKRGVPLVVQEDQCIFPRSQQSQSVIDCFLQECHRNKISIRTKYKIDSMQIEDTSILLKNQDQVECFDKVIVCTGGSPKLSGLSWLMQLGLQIVHPVPSLFTFNMPDEDIKSLMGIVVEDAMVRVQGSKIRTDGPLLFTHWGMSGPAVLKASSIGARWMHENDYQFNISVNWVHSKNDQLLRNSFVDIQREHHSKLVKNYRPEGIPIRLWEYLLKKIDLPDSFRWKDIDQKWTEKLMGIVMNDQYRIRGKTTFKEEFVTAGGVCLSSINPTSLASKKYPHLYFAGEILDIDGITGGFNFQAAWTTAYVAAQLA